MILLITFAQFYTKSILVSCINISLFKENNITTNKYTYLAIPFKNRVFLVLAFRQKLTFQKYPVVYVVAHLQTSNLKNSIGFGCTLFR